MKQQNLISEPLRYYLNIFKEQLSKPQFSNFSDLLQGLLLGHGQVSEIADLCSDKDASTLTRFLAKSPWDHELLNEQRISFCNEIALQQFMRYAVYIIDDGVTKKYGNQLPGIGRFWSNTEKKTTWGQNLISSHLLLGDLEIPLFADLYRKWEELPLVVPNFRSKVEIALDQLEKFPLIQGKEGIVMTDSWYSSQKLIGGVLQKGLIALMAIKSNRKVSFQEKYFQTRKKTAGRGF